MTTFLLVVVSLGALIGLILLTADEAAASRRRAEAARARADLSRYQARRALEAEMVKFQIRRNADWMRQELRAEMERLDGHEQWETFERWTKTGRWDA